MCKFKTYKRNIESMGEQLTLAEISSVIQPVGLLYHPLFERKGKPSLDIAIDPNNGTIVYVNFILQDELIFPLEYTPTVIHCNLPFTLPEGELTTKNYHYFTPAEFSIFIHQDSLWVLRNDFVRSSLLGYYSMDGENGLLFQHDAFAGIVYKNINNLEMEQLRISGYCI